MRPDGKPLEQPVRAKVRVTKITWQTNRLATAGDTSEFESKAQLEVLWEREIATAPGLASNRKPNIAVLEQAMAGKPGEYLLEVGRQRCGRSRRSDFCRLRSLGRGGDGLELPESVRDRARSGQG